MYDQRLWKARDPVCSPLDKLETAGLVVGWVTTSESPVLYMYFFLFLNPNVSHNPRAKNAYGPL